MRSDSRGRYVARWTATRRGVAAPPRLRASTPLIAAVSSSVSIAGSAASRLRGRRPVLSPRATAARRSPPPFANGRGDAPSVEQGSGRISMPEQRLRFTTLRKLDLGQSTLVLRPSLQEGAGEAPTGARAE